jgi:hypothetical protein
MARTDARVPDAVDTVFTYIASLDSIVRLLQVQCTPRSVVQAAVAGRNLVITVTDPQGEDRGKRDTAAGH